LLLFGARTGNDLPGAPIYRAIVLPEYYNHIETQRLRAFPHVGVIFAISSAGSIFAFTVALHLR